MGKKVKVNSPRILNLAHQADKGKQQQGVFIHQKCLLKQAVMGLEMRLVQANTLVFGQSEDPAVRSRENIIKWLYYNLLTKSSAGVCLAVLPAVDHFRAKGIKAPNLR